MPACNRRHLRPNECVVQAVTQGRFHIDMAQKVGGGLSLFMRRPFGQLASDSYPEDSVLGFRQACEALTERRADQRARKRRPRLPP